MQHNGILFHVMYSIVLKCDLMYVMYLMSVLDVLYVMYVMYVMYAMGAMYAMYVMYVMHVVNVLDAWIELECNVASYSLHVAEWFVM